MESILTSVSLRGCFKRCSGFARLQSPMALSACIDDRTNIACFGLRAPGLFARARADDPLLKHPLRYLQVTSGKALESVDFRNET